MVYRPKSSGANPLLSADGSTLLTDRNAILERLTEHFNRPLPINDNAINRLPRIEYNVLFDEFPTVAQPRTMIQRLSSGKAPGAGAILTEIYKARGLSIRLFHCKWRKEAFPENFKDASIIHRKGNPL